MEEPAQPDGFGRFLLAIALALSMAGNVAVVVAAIFLSRIDWWYLAYLFLAGLPVGLLVPPAHLFVSKMRTASPWNLRPYIWLSWALYGAWLAYSVLRAFTLSWGGH